MKKLILIFSIIFISTCQNIKQVKIEEKAARFQTPLEMIEWIKAPTKDYVMTVAHRGDWRNAPENSIKAVSNCVDLGVEIVEIDVRMTKDSALIVMHDLTLERTSTGKGKIADWPLDSLLTLKLKNGAGMKTGHKIPTLKEMMIFVKDKPILLNLDKAWNYLPQTYEILKETGTVQQSIFKGNEPLPKMREKWGSYMDSILYMPMVWPETYSIYNRDSIITPIEYTKGFFENFHPLAFEVIFDKEDSPVLEAVNYLNRKGTAVWINTLWPELCAGHHDEVAIENPDAHWGLLISKGANILQTDRPQLLIKYLKGKKLHQ
ncbi:MAG: glycerophosphodiester phosphodiesterase family protein [Flammeovirgaceae bacterium]|nr:glycerophosphodiester phosphodiesterase family protein [Flammeovirgaceae bacterium]